MSHRWLLGRIRTIETDASHARAGRERVEPKLWITRPLWITYEALAAGVELPLDDELDDVELDDDEDDVDEDVEDDELESLLDFAVSDEELAVVEADFEPLRLSVR